jgi:hypothetical protein
MPDILLSAAIGFKWIRNIMASAETQNIGPAAAKVPNIQQTLHNQNDLGQQAQIGREVSQISAERSLRRVGSSERDGVRLAPRAERNFEPQHNKARGDEQKQAPDNENDARLVDISA